MAKKRRMRAGEVAKMLGLTRHHVSLASRLGKFGDLEFCECGVCRMYTMENVHHYIDNGTQAGQQPLHPASIVAVKERIRRKYRNRIAIAKGRIPGSKGLIQMESSQLERELKKTRKEDEDVDT